jgi:hypothetical protein
MYYRKHLRVTRNISSLTLKEHFFVNEEGKRVKNETQMKERSFQVSPPIFL